MDTVPVASASRAARGVKPSVRLMQATRRRTNFTASRVDMQAARTARRSSIRVTKRFKRVTRRADVVIREAHPGTEGPYGRQPTVAASSTITSAAFSLIM